MFKWTLLNNRMRVDVLVKSSASQLVDLNSVLLPSITQKSAVYSFPARHSALRNSVEKNPPHCLDLPLEKALNDIPLSL